MVYKLNRANNTYLVIEEFVNMTTTGMRIYDVVIAGNQWMTNAYGDFWLLLIYQL